MPLTPTPHDAFFKAMFSEEKVVVDFLKARLPPKLLEAVELPGLRLEPTSYVDERLKANYSDVVDSLKIRGKARLSLCAY